MRYIRWTPSRAFRDHGNRARAPGRRRGRTRRAEPAPAARQTKAGDGTFTGCSFAYGRDVAAPCATSRRRGPARRAPSRHGIAGNITAIAAAAASPRARLARWFPPPPPLLSRARATAPRRQPGPWAGAGAGSCSSSMSIDLLPCRFLLSPSAAVRVPSRRAITLLSAGASPSTPSRSAGAPSVRQRRVRAAPSVPAKQAARPRPAGENGRTTTTRRRRRRKQQGEEGEERGERGCVPSMEEASIRVGTLYQNGDPLGRKELGRCVVEWLRQGMQSMASKFASAELQGDMADLDAAALAQEWGSADGRLGFVIQAQPYMSAIPMPKGLEALCLKACTHYPTLFDHFQRELRDVLQSCQNQGLISDWRSTQSWKLLKEMANSVQHREAVRRTVPRPKAVHGSIGVSLNKVKLMQRRIEQYVTHMSDLLCIERDVELEFTQEELNAAPMLDDDSEPPKPVEYLVSHGQSQQEQCDTICNLNVISSSTGERARPE